MEKYTLNEIKDALFKQIDELYKQDPYWRKCIKCPFKGKCCIDNDIDIRDDEWSIIESFLDNHPEACEQVKDNYLHQRKCYFRTEKECLIHSIRPLNCIYTPYQVIQNIDTKELMYHLCNENCEFSYVKRKHHLLSNDTFLVHLPKTDHLYLFLNPWIQEYYLNSLNSESSLGRERLKKYFNSK